MSADGDASHAYRGYRLQALYTLGRALTDISVTFQPEGKEDLAIYDGTSQLSEIVQVKAYADPLTLSHLEPGKKDGFFARLAREIPLPATVCIRLASYGPCGPELRQAFGFHAPKQQTVTQKIHKANSSISEEIAAQILERMLLEEVQETILKERVFARLGQLCTGIDPEKAFDLMIAWLYRAAEAKLRITQTELIQQIGSIGQFLSNTATYLHEWGTTIVPIGDDLVKYASEDRLREEYYSGSLTSYAHIQAELDIIRQDKLAAIEAKFAQAPVVVVHGASGQGKTTLAYRYLHEHFPVYCRYQVRRVEHVAHALQIVTAITNHVHVLNLPIAFYLDVTPGDTAWTEVARQLVSEPNVRLLVTIREEDWRLASLPNEVFPHVFLGLTVDEARSIYDALTIRTPSIHFLTFEDAWAAFGEAGPLMEFIHLLTQGTTLRHRLTQQIQRLEEEILKNQRDPAELAVLRIVAVAAACNGRLKVDQLASYLQLRLPRRTLERLEQEYLLRMTADGSLVGGLHPLRSRIIAELLTDPALSPRFRSAQECLPLLYEADVQPFLFASWIQYPADNHILVQHLVSWQPASWIATVGVVRALLWLGVAEYVDENRDLIREVQRDDGMGLPFLLDLDIAGLLPRGTIGLWDDLASTIGTVPEERRQAVKERQARQTDKSRVYLHVKSWLSKRTEGFLVPTDDADWLGVAEVVFWVGHLQIPWPLADWLPLSLLESAMPAMQLELVMHFRDNERPNG
jgi:hypothetical protein